MPSRDSSFGTAGGRFDCRIGGTPIRLCWNHIDWLTKMATREVEMKELTEIEKVAIAMQRIKTWMEAKSLQDKHWPAYWKLSEAIYALEESAHLSAPALRDAEDGV
jgi:hypothetical protein